MSMMKSHRAEVRKTRSMVVQKSASPSSLPIPLPSPRGGGVEFPTSPDSIYGEEIISFSHPHGLVQLELRDLYTCGGCKEYGSGKRFVCRECDFQVHDFCALAPAALKAHPLHSQHLILFHSKPGNYTCWSSQILS